MSSNRILDHMAKRNTTGNLYDPRRGDQAIRTENLRFDRKPTDPARTNYFAIYFVESGSGTFWADAASFAFGSNSLLFFVPYQHIRFVPDTPVQGEVIQFRANFLCVETFHAEVGCSGILFNDPFGIPLVALDKRAKRDVTNLIASIRKEETDTDLAYGEVMLAYLKVLLILAARIKAPQAGVCTPGSNDMLHPVLAELRDLIEQNFHTLHSPSDYAQRLHLTPKTLGRLVREHLGTTPTELIRNRILIHAKWQLLHTLKPIKEISGELAVVLSCNNLSTDESLLTGESLPVRKVEWDKVREMTRPGGEGLPFVFSGTLIVQGQGIGQVRATGLQTEMGKIGKALQTVPVEGTRLQQEVGRLVRRSSDWPCASS
jgi:AraC family transcriptional activator of pobA